MTRSRGVAIARNDRAGLRGPVGLDYLLPSTPIDVFGELVPTLNVVPGTHFTVDAAIGARYYF